MRANCSRLATALLTTGRRRHLNYGTDEWLSATGKSHTNHNAVWQSAFHTPDGKVSREQQTCGL